MKDLFLLTWKKSWILVVAGFISIVLHNVIYAIFNVEETFFFIIVVFIIPIYFIVMVVYSSIVYYKKRKN